MYDSTSYNKMKKYLLVFIFILLNNLVSFAQTPTTVEVKKNNFQLSIFPNPVSETLSVSYYLPQNSDVTFDIYNMLGAKVKTIVFEKQTQGKHESPLDFDNLSNGVYFLKITSAGSSEIVKLNVSH